MKISLQIILFTAFLFSCHKDEDRRTQVNADIAGSWLVDTWTIDGDDQFKFYDSLTIEFVPHSQFGGNSIWTTVVYQEHTSVLYEDYGIVDNGNSIFLNGDLFRNNTLSIAIQNNRLTMNGLLNTHSWYIDGGRK